MYRKERKMCKLCSKLKELKELDAKQYKHIIEAWRRRDLTARNLIAKAADAIMQLSVIKINLTINGKKVANIEGRCSETKKILEDMKTFLSSNWVDDWVDDRVYNHWFKDQSQKTKAKGKKNV